MSKRYLDKDEWFPFYTLTTRPTYSTNLAVIDPELVKRHDRIMKEFRALQSELAEFEAAAKKALDGMPKGA